MAGDVFVVTAPLGNEENVDYYLMWIPRCNGTFFEKLNKHGNYIIYKYFKP